MKASNLEYRDGMFGWFRKNKQNPNIQAVEYPQFDTSLFSESDEILFAGLARHWAEYDSRVYEARDRSSVSSRRSEPFDHSNSSETRRRVDAFEQSNSLALPSDFKAYLIFACPQRTYWDHIGTQWWALDEIKSVAEECPDWPPKHLGLEVKQEPDQYLVFADFLIWCYAWAICCSNSENRGKVAIVGSGHNCIVAGSFREFLVLELADSLEIHGQVVHSTQSSPISR